MKKYKKLIAKLVKSNTPIEKIVKAIDDDYYDVFYSQERRDDPYADQMMKARGSGSGVTR